MTDRPTPCSTPEARQFDFWIGEWDLTWPAEQAGGEPGEIMTGINQITQLYGPCVVEENFSTSDGSFRGHSVSVYDEKDARWRQTWVDSAGAYLSFSGGSEDGDMVLSTEPVESEEGVLINRMVFSDITPDSLFWRWRRTTNGGDTWIDRWTITYQRR
jgi:hypothetical protein